MFMRDCCDHRFDLSKDIVSPLQTFDKTSDSSSKFTELSLIKTQNVCACFTFAEVLLRIPQITK